jgi:hypothetical protein
MGRLLWPLALVIMFGIGWAAAGLARKEPQEVNHQQESVTRLQQQVGNLQARLHARDNLTASRQSGATAYADAPSGARAGAGWSWAGTATEERMFQESLAEGGGRARPQTGRPADRAVSAPASGGTSGSAPTVEAALDRFYRYLETMGGSDARGGWGRAREVVNDLRAMGDSGVQALMQVLTSGTDSDERRTAARLLGALQAPEALPALRDIINKDDDVLMRRAAASALRQLQTPESMPVMEKLLFTTGEDRFVRMSAAYGLAQAGQPVGVAGLVQIFDEANADGRGRDMAFRALASLDGDRSVPFMRQVVSSHQIEPSYRLQAIKYLTGQGDQQALPALQTVMQSPTEQPSIRDAAAQAYKVLGGK